MSHKTEVELAVEKATEKLVAHYEALLNARAAQVSELETIISNQSVTIRELTNQGLKDHRHVADLERMVADRDTAIHGAVQTLRGLKEDQEEVKQMVLRVAEAVAEASKAVGVPEHETAALIEEAAKLRHA